MLMLILDFLIILVCFYALSKVVDEHFIDSLDNISDWLKLPPSVAGATLLAIGTSAPELSTALFALFLPNTNPATGLGTIVGSAIFQILVVIGFAAMLRTTYLNWKPVVRDGVFYSITIVLLIFIVQDNQITFVEASSLVGCYFLYLFVLFIWSRNVDESSEPDPLNIVEETLDKKPKNGSHPLTSLLKKCAKMVVSPIDAVVDLIPNCSKNKKYTVPVFILCLAVIAAASYFVVISAERAALVLGIPSAIIALTILAGGTSVPELISSAIVSKQGRGDMAISNAIGSNIFDILMSLGLPVFIYTALNGPITDVGGSNISSSILLLFATLVAVLFLLALQKFKIGRYFGIVLIALYVVYVFAAYAGYL